MRIEILGPAGDVINTIISEPETAELLHPGAWREAQHQPDAAPPPPPPRHITVLAFRHRFAGHERAAIEWAAVDRADQPVEQRQMAASLRASLADQAAAKFIDLEDADVALGVHTLEAMGLIDPGRADEILSTPVQQEERP